MKLNLLIVLMVFVAELFWLWSIIQEGSYTLRSMTFIILIIILTILIGIKGVMLYKLEEK